MSNSWTYQRQNSIFVQLPKTFVRSPTALAGKIMQSVMSVRQFVCLDSTFWTNWFLTLIFCMHIGHDHSSPGIESQGHVSRSTVRAGDCKDGNAVGLTSILDRWQLFSSLLCCWCVLLWIQVSWWDGYTSFRSFWWRYVSTYTQICL